MSRTTEVEKEIEDEVTETESQEPMNQSADDVPSWSELFSRSDDKVGLKKSVGGYLTLSSALFLGSMFLLPYSIGFTVSMFLVALFTGLVGKHDLLGASVTGAVGGGAAATLTAGLSIITLTPLFTGVIGGLLAGALGVLGGSWLNSKIRS